MALNIKDPETERLAAEVAALTGESKTRAVRIALQERKARLAAPSVAARRDHLERFMRGEIWPQVSDDERGVVLGKREREEILGIGEDGA